MTDHRINLTLYKLEEVLNGDLEEIINGLIAAERLEAITAYETSNEKYPKPILEQKKKLREAGCEDYRDQLRSCFQKHTTYLLTRS